MRRFISIILGVLVLAGALYIAKYFIDNKNKPKPKFDKIVKTVFVEEVENKDIRLKTMIPMAPILAALFAMRANTSI